MTEDVNETDKQEHSFETGTSATVRARHVMPGLPPPEGVPHEHDYRLDVRVTRADLDDRGMVVDLDVLDAALASVVQRVVGADLERVTGLDVVTVEAFACWVHRQLTAALGGSGCVLRVRVFETAEKYGGYRAPLTG